MGLPLKKYMGLYTPKEFCENYSFTPKFYSTLTLYPCDLDLLLNQVIRILNFIAPLYAVPLKLLEAMHAFLQICITSCGLYMYPEGVPGSIFAAYVPLMSHNPYSICI